MAAPASSRRAARAAPAARAAAAPAAASPALRRGLSLAVLALAFLAFAPALTQGFVELDDDRNFLQNEAYRGLSGQHLEWMFTTFHLGHYQPLSWVTLGADYLLWGVDPRGYHLTNLLLHAVGSLLLYRVAVELLCAAAPSAAGSARLHLAAAAAALLHAVHPLRVESVAWVTERRDVLSGLFLFASLLCYLRMARAAQGGGGWLALALLWYALSLFSKAWGITLPAVLLVLDVWPLRRPRSGVPWKRLLLEKLAFAPLALLSAWLAARAQGGAAAVVSLEEHGLLQRAAQASYGLVFYPLKTLWPTDLSAMYLLERELDPARPVYVASMVAVVAVTAALVLLRKRAPWALAAWLCYGILASPVLGLLQSGSQKVADRYTYLAAAPFALLAGGLLLVLLRRVETRGGLRAAILRVGLPAAVLVALLAGLSVAQTRVWRDSEALYRRMVEVEPDNYFAQHGLSVILFKQGRFAEALEHSRASVAAHPLKGNEEARYTMGLLHQRLGDPEAALEAWRGALSVAPDHANSLRMLEGDLLRQGELEQAAELYERAVAANPLFAEGWQSLARLRQRAGEPAGALEVWRRAAAAAPQWAAPRHVLGVHLLDTGRPQEAREQLLFAVRMEPFNPEYLTDLGRAHQALGELDEAQRLWRQAIAVSGHPRARGLLQRSGGR